MSAVLESHLDSQRKAQADAADGLAPAPAVSPCAALPQLTDEQCRATDDMAGFLDLAKTEFREQFQALGFGETAAGELAELHIFGGTQ